jgi:hypothetical protein
MVVGALSHRAQNLDMKGFIIGIGSNPRVRAFLPWRFRHTNKLRKK